MQFYFQSRYALSVLVVFCVIVLDPKLKLVQECGFKNVVCQTNCLNAYYFLQHVDDQNQMSDRDLADKIMDLSLQNWEVHFEYTSQEANKAADWLVKKGARDQRDYIEWLQPNVDFLNVLLADIA
ncbi:hypothetical protein PIB30_033217 [Stylosanthes scabra]|uniref:RNase H type-1 domain-containing protein n=1 Tax=Stylosanthes scabra TaxID=79078 RepID=A0ABU6TC59_9FABA|nr:hypothetical protein [Stylosanthes scabra]